MIAMLRSTTVDYITDQLPMVFSGWTPVEIPADTPVEPGWHYINGQWLDGDGAAPIVAGMSLAAAIEAKRAAIQAEKTRIRDGGFDVEGIHYDSDPAARLAYGELADNLRDDPAYTTPWRASEGAWVTMDASLYAKVRAAGTVHIEACFAWQGQRDAEMAAIASALAAGTMTSEEALAAVDAVSAAFGGAA